MKVKDLVALLLSEDQEATLLFEEEDLASLDFKGIAECDGYIYICLE